MTIEEQQMGGRSRTMICVVPLSFVEYDFWLVSWTIPPSGGGAWEHNLEMLKIRVKSSGRIVSEHLREQVTA